VAVARLLGERRRLVSGFLYSCLAFWALSGGGWRRDSTSRLFSYRLSEFAKSKLV